MTEPPSPGSVVRLGDRYALVAGIDRGRAVLLPLQAYNTQRTRSDVVVKDPDVIASMGVRWKWLLIRAAAPFTTTEPLGVVGRVPADVMVELVRVLRRSGESVRVERMKARE